MRSPRVGSLLLLWLLRLFAVVHGVETASLAAQFGSNNGAGIPTLLTTQTVKIAWTNADGRLKIYMVKALPTAERRLVASGFDDGRTDHDFNIPWGIAPGTWYFEVTDESDRIAKTASFELSQGPHPSSSTLTPSAPIRTLGTVATTSLNSPSTSSPAQSNISGSSPSDKAASEGPSQGGQPAGSATENTDRTEALMRTLGDTSLASSVTETVTTAVKQTKSSPTSVDKNDEEHQPNEGSGSGSMPDKVDKVWPVPSPAPTGLNMGEKVGIGVGVASFVVIMALLTLYLF